MYYLGIDIGTTNTKALLLNGDLEWVAEGSASYGIDVSGGRVEQNPDDWWQAVVSILRSFWRKGIDPGSVGGVAVSGHGCALVVTDRAGNVLRPAISSLDTRCEVQTNQIRQTSRELILQINGNDVGAFNFEPKLLWLKQNEPDHYRSMTCFLSPTGYINLKLSGMHVLNVSDGGIGMAYNRREGGAWSADIIESIGLDFDKFPPLAACSELIGTVTSQASKATGLPTGIPVFAGGEDTSSAALAAGVTRAGMGFSSLGTQGTIGVCTDRFEPCREILAFPHVVSGLTLLSGSVSTFGAGLQWFLRVWGKDLERSENPYEALMQACKNTEAGAGGLLFLPYLSGELHPILDENAAGVFFGLKLHHTREQMARAVMEGTAHALRHNLGAAEQKSGEAAELRVVGGPARNALWCQIIADVLGRPVKVMAAEGGDGGAPLGNVLLMANRLNGCDLDSAAAACVKVKSEYVPAASVHSLYRQHHEVYKEIYRRTKDLFPLMQKH